jgi:hypothetical protein
VISKQLMIGLALTLASASTSLSAQQPDAGMLGAAMASNQESLRSYAWQSRVEVAVDGEEEKVSLYQVRYNLDGELEKTPLGGSAEEKKVRGPVRKRVAKNKKQEAGEFAQALNQQLHRYMAPEAFTKAISGAFVRKDAGTIRLRSEGVVVPGDTVEFEIMEATRQPVSMQVGTVVDEAPVDMTITFQQLRDGPNYPARQVVKTQFGKKPLVITTENFNYTEQGG